MKLFSFNIFKYIIIVINNTFIFIYTFRTGAYIYNILNSDFFYIDGNFQSRIIILTNAQYFLFAIPITRNKLNTIQLFQDNISLYCNLHHVKLSFFVIAQ